MGISPLPLQAAVLGGYFRRPPWKADDKAGSCTHKKNWPIHRARLRPSIGLNQAAVREGCDPAASVLSQSDASGVALAGRFGQQS